jgi:hypothetical protein
MTIDTITTRPATVGQRRRTVAWGTVLLLAAVMAYADGFWMTALQGAVGSIERSQSPFTNWWHQSTVALPFYILAVLGAFTLAQHWFGPVLRKYRAVAATALLVIAAGTVVGIVQIVASSAYDYHLQSSQLRMMASMHGISAQAQHATLVLHIHAVIYVSRWLLLTNLILIIWMVAMLGGRLKVSTPRHFRTSTNAGAGAGNLARDARLILAAALLASAAIHLAVTPEHLTEWAAAAAFFILLSITEIAAATLLFTRLPQRSILIATTTISLAPLILWLYSRTAGMPFGPSAGTPETIGLPDIAACILELTALLTALTLLRTPTWPTRPPTTTHTKALALITLTAITTIGLAATTTTWSPTITDMPSHSATTH